MKPYAEAEERTFPTRSMAYTKALREENLDKFMDFLNERKSEEHWSGRSQGPDDCLYREWIKD